MATDPIVSCLRDVTDYSQFERLCNDLMRLEGYSQLEPIGGTQDKGRDALHTATDGKSSVTTVFAYSARGDWKVKLAEDTEKVRKHGHACERFCFLSTAEWTTHERDTAIADTKKRHGFDVELYGVERLRTILASQGTHLITLHPQIFTPSLFSSLPSAVPDRLADFVMVDFGDADALLGRWLTRKLLAAGYRVWSPLLNTLAGDGQAAAAETVLREHARALVSLYATRVRENPDVSQRRATALALANERKRDVLIPGRDGALSAEGLSSRERGLNFVEFGKSWAAGLAQVVAKLEQLDVPHKNTGGTEVALASFLQRSPMKDEAETLYSNVFVFERVPRSVLTFDVRHGVKLAASDEELRPLWSFRRNEHRFWALHRPPQDIVDRLQLVLADESPWQKQPTIDGISSTNLVSELLKKSLVPHAVKLGLTYAAETNSVFFAAGMFNAERLYFDKPDGSRSFFTVTGRKKLWRPHGRESYYRYHLSPEFRLRRDLGSGFSLQLRPRLRLTDDAGVVLAPKLALSRRKDVCKTWWNNDWFSRVIGLACFLANGAATIRIADAGDEDPILIKTQPLTWQVPCGIDEEALASSGVGREDVLVSDDDDDDDEGDDVAAGAQK